MSEPVSRPPLTLVAKRSLPRTDLGNAERFVAQHGDNVRFLPAWGKWLLWTGTHWKIDDTLEVKRFAKETVRSMYAEAKEQPSEAGRIEMARHAAKSEAEGKIRAMLELVKAEGGVAITTSALDADPCLLACQNGTIDLRTGKLGGHDRTHMITKLVPAPYGLDANCPRWLAFLDRVLAGNAELRDFLQRAIGYSLTGLTSARVLFFLYGAGANGKSTFLEVLRALMAGYAAQADFTTFLERKGDGPRNDIARLFGARLVTSSEVGEGKRLNESLVKTLTGDETVTARYLHAEFFEFRPAFKLWLAANHKPVIRGTDNAIWDRIKLIPFTVSIPLEERDKGLREALLAELPGVLAWAVGGAVLWHRNGLGTPTTVTAATDSYRKESDALGAFLEESCELNPMWEEPASVVYAGYTQWCQASGEYAVNARLFGQALAERGVTTIKRGGRAIRVGIKLISASGS